MCHDDDSRPPGPPTVGAVGRRGLVELQAADGNRFAAYQAGPADDAAAPNVVILPDVRGLYPYYEELAVRFAEAGFHVVAIDYFGRTNGVGRRGDDFDWRTEIAKVRPEHVTADVGAAAAFVREAHPGPVFTVGFCFGGSQSWRQAAGDLPLAGCVGFYGRPGLVEEVEDDIHLPLLLLVAGADAATPVSTFEAFDARLTAAGREHEMYVYDGAPHSFFDRSYGEWRAACDDAWRRMLTFMSAHS